MANKVEEIKQAKDGLDVWPDLLRYSRTGYESITPDDMARLRWYGIYEQQPKVGHFMMRVKIPGGDISATQWRALGEIARDYGRGIADITTRQNVQFHWLTIETIPEVIRKLNSVGLTTVGACGDITRNIAGCPVAGLDPDEIYDCREIVHNVTRYFLGNKEFSDLPRKYKMTIAGCPYHCHQPEINDVGISAVRRRRNGQFEVGFHVRVGGGLSTQPYVSQQLDVFVTPEQVPEVCRAITEIFRDYGYRERRNRARLKFLVADWGAVRFRDALIERLGWTPEPAVPCVEPENVYRDHMGVHAQKQPGLSWIGAAVLTGRLTADRMLAAADIAERYCAGALRTTNQQNLLFPNIAQDDLVEAQESLREAGFAWEVSPFRKAAIACTGTEFCNLAITETKNRLREIVSYLEERLEWDEEIRINLNGCPNSCGQHHIGDIGLQGCLAKVGDEKVEAYDICLGGRLGAGAKFTRPIRRKVPADKVKYALENLLRAYRRFKSDDEDFSDFVDRHTDEELGAFLGQDLLAEPDPEFTPPPLLHTPAGVE
jgi:sulfite reductase beta subunit-like hemoprotein